MLKFRRDIGDSQEKVVVLHADITVVLVKVNITEKDIIDQKVGVTIPLGLVNKNERGVDMAEERKCFLCI